MAKTVGNEAVIATPIVDMSGVGSFDDALAALQSAGVTVERISEYGDGFILLNSTDKKSLVGIPFVIIDSQFRTDKETAREYATFRIMTGDGRKLIVNDGSTGLYRQAQELTTKRGSLAGLVVTEGLSGGEYTTEINGEIVKASTFYFAGV